MRAWQAAQFCIEIAPGLAEDKEDARGTTVTPDSDPPFPRPPANSENLRRLRAEAEKRLNQEQPTPVVIYGGPPAPVYGGPPSGGGSGMNGGKRVTRRWTIAGLVALALGAIWAALWRLLGRNPFVPATVYGGPPAPVYGGPAPTPQVPVNPAPAGPDSVTPSNPQPHKSHQSTQQPLPRQSPPSN